MFLIISKFMILFQLVMIPDFKDISVNIKKPELVFERDKRYQNEAPNHSKLRGIQIKIKRRLRNYLMTFFQSLSWMKSMPPRFRMSCIHPPIITSDSKSSEVISDTYLLLRQSSKWSMVIELGY